MNADLIVYQFSREKVERGDFSHFLTLYGSDKLPQGLPLKQLMGRLAFCVEGYDVDPREIYLIDEVRRFYGAFHDAWPYWLYFCDLHQDSLRTSVSCCLRTFTAFKVDGRTNCPVEYDLVELVQLIAHELPSMNDMCERSSSTSGCRLTPSLRVRVADYEVYGIWRVIVPDAHPLLGGFGGLVGLGAMATLAIWALKHRASLPPSSAACGSAWTSVQEQWLFWPPTHQNPAFWLDRWWFCCRRLFIWKSIPAPSRILKRPERGQSPMDGHRQGVNVAGRR